VREQSSSDKIFCFHPHQTFVFPGLKPGKPLSNMAMETMLRRMKVQNALFTASAQAFAIGLATFPVPA
jgi:hypothetical protein